MYTLEDIARELGVSKTTVSRALSGKGRISKTTVERVRAFAREHDYRPNMLAQGLAVNKTYNLALFIPMGTLSNDEYSFFKECMVGINDVAADAGYDILMSIERKGMPHLQRLVSNRKADGIILSRTEMNSEEIQFLKKNRIPFVVIGPINDDEIVSVDNPNEEACEELTELFIMKGNRRLVLIGGNEKHYVNESRKTGFVKACRRNGIPANDVKIHMGVDSLSKARQVTEQLPYTSIDGILCMDEYICGMILGSLREKRIKVPEQIKLASMYDSRELEYNIPPVTAIRFRTKNLGRNVCVQMLKMLGEPVTEEYALGYQIILRESTK